MDAFPLLRIETLRLKSGAATQKCERDVKISGGGLVDRSFAQRVPLPQRRDRRSAALVRERGGGAVFAAARGPVPFCPPRALRASASRSRGRRAERRPRTAHRQDHHWVLRSRPPV